MRSTTESATDARRRPTNVTLPEVLLAQARDLEINVSAACEKGLAEVVAQKRRDNWVRENRPALEAWDAYFAEHGLPLAEYRQF